MTTRKLYVPPILEFVQCKFHRFMMSTSNIKFAKNGPKRDDEVSIAEDNDNIADWEDETGLNYTFE